MINIGHFEEELKVLKREHEHGFLAYSDSSHAFSDVVTAHFRKVQRDDKQGVYIVRQQSTGEILYIGKGGTIDDSGHFQKQDIPGRLKAVRGAIYSNDWFRTLVDEKGSLVIEYMFLATTPKSPALIEAVLLQAYFNEYDCLPYRNKEF